jgi:hypothetical protein
MFSVVRPVSFNAQLGPYESFTELQAAVAREIPGAIIVPGGANATQGHAKGASGEDLGMWHSVPFTFVHPVSFTAYTGPCETIEELQVKIAQQVPGAVLVPPAKRLLGSEKVGEVRDSSGRVIGQWIEVR